MIFGHIWRGYGALLYGLGLIAALATAIMMFLVVCNALARYLFNAPINGAFEITESLLTVVVFLSLALTLYGDGHIRVILLTQRFSPRVQRIVRIFTLLLGAVFFAWCSYGTWGFAMESYLTNEQEWGSIQFPLYPVKFLVFAGLVLLSVQYVLSAIHEAVSEHSVNEGVAQ